MHCEDQRLLSLFPESCLQLREPNNCPAQCRKHCWSELGVPDRVCNLGQASDAPHASVSTCEKGGGGTEMKKKVFTYAMRKCVAKIKHV